METIEVARTADGVVTVTLNRPEKKNAINATMWDELLAVFREMADSADDRVVVLTGAGGAFCSGADLSDGANIGGPAPHPLARMRHVGDVAFALHRVPQPTIAKVSGVAAGAGANLALGCDLIVASDEARFTRDLRPSGPERRCRRLLAAAPPHRSAPGQGAGLLRRHHLGQGGRVVRAREPGGARRRARRLRRRLGAAPRRRSSDRAGPDEAAAERQLRGAPWDRLSTARVRRRP